MIGAKIVLVGMPGAGKSTLGQQLAKSLDYDFVDLDDAIETLSGQKIPDLFKISEDHFRAAETAALLRVIEDQRSLVIASGGGTPCFNDNMSLILQHSISVFLDPPMDVLVSRTEKESHRPLLQGQDVQQRLSQLYGERQRYYELAHIRVTSGSPTTQELIQLIDTH